jgi:16S rRNA (cytosine967-C5)-methyltransferase
VKCRGTVCHIPPTITPGFFLKPDSLATSLLGAAYAIASVRGGTALPRALSLSFARFSPSPATRGATQDLAYRTMRRWGTVEALMGLLVPKPPEPLLHGLLSCALGLLVDEHDPAYEGHTVVDQAVTAAASNPDTSRAKGMVNAVLRRFLRERASLMATVSSLPSAVWNYPDWWIKASQAAWPAGWQSLLQAGNSEPPLSLRINRRKTTVEEFLALLASRGMAGRKIGPAAVRLHKPVPVQQIPGFEDGLASVQDAAAQGAAPLLDVQDGMRVLDACAAPGGKTGHLLELADLDLVALDQDGQRLNRVSDNLRRLGLDARLQTGDAAAADWWDGKPFDRILADVPCTASGIVRRHPDIRWLRRPEDTRQLAALSARIIDNLWRMVAPGGKLLLVTCSIWPVESEGQAASFAVRHSALRLAAPGQLMPTAGDDDDHDGLFYALFQKPAV